MPLTFEQRFWAKVSTSGYCWEWQGTKTTQGYGQIYRNGRSVRAHRASFEMVNGPIPTGMVICHKCDNPCCVKPDHLFLGTQSDNLLDAVDKGRWRGGQSRGEKNGTYTQPETVRRGTAVNTARLSSEDVAEIRRLKGTVFQKDLAKRYGVDRTTIQRAQSGRSWNHV